MSNVRANQFQGRQAGMGWRIHIGIVAFLLLLGVLTPIVLAYTVGLAGYANYIALVLVPALLVGTLPVEWLIPRVVNGFALRYAGSDETANALRIASKTAWISDLVLRGSVAILFVAILVVFDIPAPIERIGLTVTLIMIFVGFLNLIIGPRLARELDEGEANLDRQVAHGEAERAAQEGIRPRDWDSLLMQRCIGPADESVWEIRGLWFAYYHALDSRQNDGAEMIVKRMTEIARPTHVPWVSDAWHEAAFVAAFLHSDPEVARGCLRFLRKSKGTTQPYTRHRVEAAVYLAEGNQEEARRHARLGLEALAEKRDSGVGHLDEDLLREILEQAYAS